MAPGDPNPVYTVEHEVKLQIQADLSELLPRDVQFVVVLTRPVAGTSAFTWITNTTAPAVRSMLVETLKTFSLAPGATPGHEHKGS